jgi:hypothetical protein
MVWRLAVAAVIVSSSAAIAQEPKLSTSCAAYSSPGLQALCTHNEALAASTARWTAARDDLRASELRANAARENRACAARIKSELARGRIAPDELEHARKNRQSRADLSCRLLRDLMRR